MSFSVQVATGGQSGTTLSPTTLANPTGPGAVITVTGNGPNATANIVGPHNDAADLWGIVVVLAVILLAIASTRWLFGRVGTGPPRPVAGPPGPPPETGR